MGSRPKIDLAYIAGFLDGDGSLMLQVKKRKDGRQKKRFMCTICFYQDTRHERPLLWIRKVLRMGYVSRRNDGMSELRINGFVQVRNILKELLPFIRFKKVQAEHLLRAADLLSTKSINFLSRPELRKLLKHISAIQEQNYRTGRKKTRAELEKMLGLTP